MKIAGLWMIWGKCKPKAGSICRIPIVDFTRKWIDRLNVEFWNLGKTITQVAIAKMTCAIEYTNFVSAVE